MASAAAQAQKEADIAMLLAAQVCARGRVSLQIFLDFL
jgi:hypothetical protein